MAENRSYNDSPTFIPARLESSVHSSIPGNGNKGPVADAKDIYDIEHQKWQKDVNKEVEEQGEHLAQVDESLNGKYDKNETYSKTEVDAKESGLQGQINTIKGGSTKSIATLDNEINGTGGIDQRLEVVEELGSISVGGGDIGIGTAADFESDDPEDLAKVPTISAMLGGANDGVYDISARHSGTKYADLAAALGTNGANIPQSLRKGGMSVKFVQSSDNNYVQYRYMSSSTAVADFANVANWQGVDEELTEGSKNLIESGTVKRTIQNVTYGLGSVNEHPLYGDPTWIWGKFCDRNGHLGYDTYAGRKDFSLKKGQIISRTSQDTASAIVKQIEGTNNYDVLVGAYEAGKTYYYYVPEDGIYTVFIRNNPTDTVPSVVISPYENGLEQNVGMKLNATMEGEVSSSSHSFVHHGGWIAYSDGSLKNYGSLDDELYLIPNKGYKTITISSYFYNNNPSAISFYSSNEINSDYYIKSASVQAVGTRSEEIHTALVPENCKLIVVGGHPSFGDISFVLNEGMEPFIGSDIAEGVHFEDTVGLGANNVQKAIENLSEKCTEINDYTDYQYPNLKDIKLPFKLFGNDITLWDAAQLPAEDWRSKYPALGYDIVWDSVQNRYTMLYAAYNNTITQIGAAFSTDLTTWTQYQNNPILSPTGVSGDPDEGGMTFPQLIWDENHWIMYYVGFSQTGFERGVHKICYATSTDLINWTRGGVVLTTQAFIDKGYNMGVIYRPRVRKYFGKYYMFINGGAGDAYPGGPDESIYVAVSDNPISGWEVIGKAIDATVIFADSDYKICSDPDVIYNGKTFILACWGRDGILFFTSSNAEFPLTWHKETFETTGMRPLMIKQEDKFYLYKNDRSSATKMQMAIADYINV